MTTDREEAPPNSDEPMCPRCPFAGTEAEWFTHNCANERSKATIEQLRAQVSRLRGVARYAEKLRDLDANESMSSEWVQANASATRCMYAAVARLKEADHG